MIPFDWANMCQAVWRSPLLPLQNEKNIAAGPHASAGMRIGSGAKFKRDLLSYLVAYGPQKTSSLVQQLRRFDFSAVRAALIASVPSKQKISDVIAIRLSNKTWWGWPALKNTLSHIALRREAGTGHPKRPHIVIQVSILLVQLFGLVPT